MSVELIFVFCMCKYSMVSVERGILLKYVVNLSACGLGTEAVL